MTSKRQKIKGLSAVNRFSDYPRARTKMATDTAAKIAGKIARQ
jgi:hypothetical protein